jgi:cell division protein FtsQ
LRRYSNRRPRRNNGPPFRERLGRWLRRLAVLGVVLAVAAGAWLVYQSPLLRVASVSVTGADNLDPAALAAASGLKGQNILTPDTAAAKAHISEMAMVKSVSIERHWPGRMVIKVEERQPWGYWQVKDQPYVIDDEGVVLDGGRPGEGAPTIVNVDSEQQYLPGERVDADAVALAKSLIESSPRALGRGVQSLEYSNHSGLTAVLEGGLRATFGDSRDLDYKLSVLYVLLQRAREQSFEVHAVDLRFGESVSFQ